VEKEKEVCGSKIVREDVTGAPRTEKQKERMEIKKQPREMMFATCDARAEQMCATRATTRRSILGPQCNEGGGGGGGREARMG